MRRSLDAEGVPHLAWFDEGYVAGRDTFDPETDAPVSVDFTVVEAELVDLCRVLDHAAGDPHDDHPHGEEGARYSG